MCTQLKKGNQLSENTVGCLSVSSELSYKAAKMAAPIIPARTALKPTWREAIAEGVGVTTVSEGEARVGRGVSWETTEVFVSLTGVDIDGGGTSVEAPVVVSSTEEVIGASGRPVGTAEVTPGTETLTMVVAGAEGAGVEVAGPEGAGPGAELQSVTVTVTATSPMIPVSMAILDAFLCFFLLLFSFEGMGVNVYLPLRPKMLP